MDKSATFWTVPVTVEDIPETGLHLEIEAPAAVRPKIAQAAGLRDLPRLSAQFDLTRRGAGARVTGQVSATVGQTCVVTLEPIESAVEEPVDLVFAPQVEAAASRGPRAADKRAKAGTEPPEPLVGGTLDLGALATEFLMLGIDPYPRKAGAKFATPKVEEPGANPFAALKALKRRSGNEQP